MKEEIISALARGTAFLLAQHCEDGNFEGELSSSTFPSCAYAWIQLARGETPEPTLIEWFIENQNADGGWGLDTANISNVEATRFVHLILDQIHQRAPDPSLEKLLVSIPKFAPHLALVKLADAAFDQFDWNELTLSENALPLMKLARQLTKIPLLGSRLKPPRHRLPPVALFNTAMFDALFIAEQHTLVPVFILIELNTTKRPEMIAALVAWLKTHVLSDGSWFRVNYITALSVLALIELQEKWEVDEEITELIERGIAWLHKTRNSDGGCREALNLNVWDTALSIIALTDVHNIVDEKSVLFNTELTHKVKYAAQWLVEHQNSDGGWAFSGLRDSSLPSDADDTALGTLALLRALRADTFDDQQTLHAAIHGGITWLKTQQVRDGSWSTYQPGQGDVGCVSITAHAIEALMAFHDCDITDKPQVQTEIQRGIHWLRRQIHRDGYWRDLWLAKDTYGTACAITALVKVGLKNVAEIQRGVEWLERSQNADGGWGEDMFGNPTESTVEQTAWSTYALLQVNPENRAAQNGIKFLHKHQREDGSWREQCVGIYWEIIGGYADPIYASVFPILALNQFAQTSA
jgi:squalene cyclase